LVVIRFSGYRARHPYTEQDVRRARDRSVRGSRSVLTGKIQEHMAPLLAQFAERFNLQEARFVGAPIDYIIFDGLDVGEDVEVVTSALFGSPMTATGSSSHRRELTAVVS